MDLKPVKSRARMIIPAAGETEQPLSRCIFSLQLRILSRRLMAIVGDDEGLLELAIQRLEGHIFNAMKELIVLAIEFLQRLSGEMAVTKKRLSRALGALLMTLWSGGQEHKLGSCMLSCPGCSFKGSQSLEYIAE